MGKVSTDELIRALREQAVMYKLNPLRSLLEEAADELEKLDERVSIMQESMEAEWGRG